MVQVANPTAAFTDLWLPTLTVQRTTVTGSHSNFVIDAPYLLLLCAPAAAAMSLTGLAFPSGNVDGSRVVIENIGSWPVLIADQDGASTAANRFFAQATIAPGSRAVAMYDGTTARWRLSTDPIAIYPAVLSPVSNTTTQTTVLSFTVPAGTWRDGHMIQVPFVYNLINTTGSDRTFDLDLVAGAGADAPVIIAQNVPNGTSTGVFRLISMIRDGSDVMELLGQGLSAPANFTSAQSILLRVTLSFASANFSFTPTSGQVIHYKGEA